MTVLKSAVPLLFCAVASCQTATLGPHLQSATPADRHTLTLVRQAMTAQHWSGIRLFPEQSFPLSIDGKLVGTLISGDANPPHDTDKCFITLVEPDRPLTVLRTEDDWKFSREFPACASVRALGLLPSPSPGTLRLGVLYYANMHIMDDPHGALIATSAFVLRLDLKTHRITIDQPATDQASKTQPENLPALAATLKP